MNDSAQALQTQVRDMQQELSDLDIALTTAVEHGDFIEDQLSNSNELLQKEIDERRAAEERLKNLVNLITQQKGDLEILIDTVIQHGDDQDYRWLETLHKVEHDSLTDSLTQIANRRHFDHFYSREWKRAIRCESEMSLLMIDLDHFKEYNDHYGHPEGDACLQRVVKVFENCLDRASDLVARYGGEEFAIVLPGTSLEGAETLAKKIQTQLADAQIPHSTSPVAEYVTISIGIANCYPSFSSNQIIFLEHADHFLYQAKEQGRNSIATDTNSNSSDADKEATNKTYGNYRTVLNNYKTENINLCFIPGAAPIQQRWKNNGLSADFLAGYLQSFFPPNEQDAQNVDQTTLSYSISFIANELLENAMKYSASNQKLPCDIQLYLSKTRLTLLSTNYVTPDNANKLVQFIDKLGHNDVQDLLIQQLEFNAENEGASGGLGYLTMMTDHDANIAWRLQARDSQTIKVFVQVNLDLYR